MGDKLTNDLEQFKEYFTIGIVVSDKTLAPIIQAENKITKEKLSFHLLISEIKSYDKHVSKNIEDMFKTLKAHCRNNKIDKLI